MFAKARHRDSISSNPPTSQTPVSPLDQRFDRALDAHLASPISLNSDHWRPSADAVRRRTSDGVRRNTVSLQPPVLPPIPRVASRNEGYLSFESKKEQASATKEQEHREHTGDRSLATQESAAGLATRNGSQPESSSARRDPSPVELPAFTSRDNRDTDSDEPKMEATMFPRPQAQASNDPFAAGPPMSRSFIDSRDRPYANNLQRPPAVASSYSSPDVPNKAQSSTAHANYSIHPPRVSSAARSTPPSATSLDAARKTPSATGTNYSGSTARPSIQSTKTASASPLSQTIGTPYSETSAAFPAPQHVATRPKTLGSSSTIAGVMVPTHHTNTSGKPEKRKTRLLNPMALLARRRSGQDTAHVPDEALRRAHEQAQARQKSVATAGIHTIPEDFDPRIRGKIVHDFNAPRPRRTFSSNDVDIKALADNPLQSAGSMPAMPSVPGQQQYQRRPPMHSAQTSDVSSRHSRHTPIFIEHLYDEPDQNGQPHGIQAERLENKDFLKRASHQSNHSHDSSTLPPFARRSQHMDPMQASFFRDDDSSKHSSVQSGVGIRESADNTGTTISPVVPRESMSSVTSDGNDKKRRPVSDMSMLGGRFEMPIQGDTRGHAQTPSVSTIDENSSPRHPPNQSQNNSSHQPKAIHPALRNLINGPNSPKPPIQDLNSSPSSPGLDYSITSTPEPAMADAAVALQHPTTPPRLVEKRASAVGHSKRATSLTPKHAASNASRFSFQDASAAEEKALEEKHRRVATADAERKKSMREQDEDDEDYFDEDAMDDEDEMEAEMRMHDTVDGDGFGGTSSDGVARFQHQPENHIKSGASSVYEDEDAAAATVAAPARKVELTYAEHPAFRGHSAVYSSRHTSMAPSLHYASETNDGWHPQHHRFQSDATVTTLTDSDNGQRIPRSDFYLQPHAAGYNNDAVGGRGPNRDSTMTVSTVQSNGDQNQQPQLAANTVTSPKETQNPRFSGFKFIDSPERSRPTTSEDPHQPTFLAMSQDLAIPGNAFSQAVHAQPAVQPSETSYAYNTDETPESAAYYGSIGHNIRARNATINQNHQYAASSKSITDDGMDDMYFDDGGFSQDVQSGSGYGESINEDDLDHPEFAGGFRGMEPRGYHERHASSVNGPYPTFAMPNPAKAHQRESQMLLEDLPLQDPADPHSLPRRNPSEDAKRLGLSDRVPPLPAQPGTEEAMPQMAAYHQALADAANRAAEDGRFARDESSAEESSVYSKKEEQESSKAEKEASGENSQPLGSGTGAVATTAPSGPVSQLLSASNADVNRTASQTTTGSQYSQPSANYTMPRMSGFDFGFDAPASDISNETPSDDINAAPVDDYSTSHLDDAYDDGEDDDFIAAANAEALAYDDSGFYGQEFGFYARARSDSAGSANGAPLEAINGGFFGEDGDDPLRRQKSGREPDLTPITERSEFSARNSFINFGPASATWGHPGVASPALARLPLSPLGGGVEGQAKGRASGGGYFGVFPPPHIGASPATSDSPVRPWTTSDSPVSATSSSSRGAAPFANSSGLADVDATPRKPQAQAHGSSPLGDAPATAKKNPSTAAHSHSRNPSGADSVTYVREGEGESGAPPRWVLERRRTSELGVDEVVGREVVRDGWI